MRMTTKQAARGKWDGILSQLLGEGAVRKKHGPCPICGGADRYRYDNKRNDGDWFCNVCGVGDGFRLLQEALGIDFATAARRVDEIVNNIEERPFKPQIDIEQRRQLMNATWALAQEPFFAFNYLIGRGIPSQIVEQVGSDVRGAEKLRLYDGKENLGNHNAMLALIRNAKGVPISIHRTYLTVDGKQKKIMPPLENITGGCVRLGEPNDTLVLAEGIETALAAWALMGHPAWATISAHGLAEFKAIPRHVKRVIIAADNDNSFTGQAAAFECAKYMEQRLKVQTVVTMPKTMNTDMLDLLNELSGDSTLLHGNEHQIGLMRWAP
jgi:putative DNA primase/helicase